MEIFKNEIDNLNIKLDIGANLDLVSQTVSGNIELDIESQNKFIDFIDTVLDEKKVNILVNMINVTYIDSSGLWSLFEAHKKAIQHEKKLILLNPTKDVKRVLEITKISTKIKIFDSEEKALSSLG